MRKIVMFFIAMCCALFCIPQGARSVSAAAESANTYYAQKLDAGAKKIYTALEKMAENDDFANGSSFDLLKNGNVSNAEIRNFQNGEASLLKSFGAARDAFYLDHPELFYVNFDKLSLSLKSKGEDFVATIDAGRDGSYLADGFETSADIAAAKVQYSAAVEAIKANLSSMQDDYSKVVAANKYLCENVTYSFEADGTTRLKAQIRTPYGALVSGYAVCEGFARAFKAIMDQVGIPCVEVVGFVANDNGGYESHAWNYVQLDSKWFLVDSTLNSSSSATKYLLLGSEESKDHIASGEISNSGYEVKYPALATYSYGKEEIKTTVSYDDNTQHVAFAFANYTSVAQMEEQGLYLAIRHENFDEDTNEYEGWYNFYQVPGESQKTMVLDFNRNVFSSQLVVTKQAPNMGYIYTHMDETQIVAKSDVLKNEVYSPEKVAPKALSVSPSASSVLEVDRDYVISITYDKSVKIANSSLPIGIKVFSEKSSNLESYVKVSNVQLDGNTISFSFSPSKMYEHDNLSYNFVPTNVVSSNGDLAPNPTALVFARPWAVCSKIYDDGRLYINSYGSPVLIDGSDLSMTGFLDQNGTPVAQNQRSQLVLVAKKPNEDLQEDMTENATSMVTSGSIEKSATYEIDLHICGGVAKIPSGSYVKVAFGFPEGYGPQDKGVTFKVFHFKKDSSGNIIPDQTEELDCVVTEYGIVVTVSDFSPFLVAAVKKATTTTKNIYARSITSGGTFASQIAGGTATNAAIVKLSSGEKIVYTISAKTGYEVDYVMLGRRELTLQDSKITLSYDELENNNELKIAYVAQSVASREQANGETSLAASFQANETVATTTPAASKDALPIILALAACVVIPVAIALGASTISKKKKFAKK